MIDPRECYVPLDGFILADFVSDARLSTYVEDIQILWDQVVQVQTNVRILGHVLSFPFEETGIDPHPFWTTTSRALFESTILGLWRLLLDNEPDVLTLPRLKNELIRTIDDEDKQKAWGRAIKARLGKRNTNIEQRLATIRHKYLAHRSREHPSEPDPLGPDSLVALSELCTIKNYAITLLAVLSFGHGRSADYLEYSDLVTPRSTTDVEHLLDLLVKDSNWLNLPERDPAWPAFRANMSTAELELFRKFRTKFNLPLVT